MDDTISRQAAIDELDVGAGLLRLALDDTDVVGVEREKYEWGLGLIESYISDMKELPSAQPNVPDTNVGEIISILSDIRSKYNCLDAAERPYYHALSEAINALSEQPENVRCKDCVRFDERRGCNLVEGLNIAKPDSYCSYAERREG